MLTQIRDDLWETQGDSPFPGLTTHAYLWTGATGGNVLLYSTVTDRDFDEIEKLGGVAHQYLSHRDEAGPMVRVIRSRFGATLHAGIGDRAAISPFSDDPYWIDTRTVDDTGVEVLPTPGHTPGSTCFLVHGCDDQRYLFVGDTLYLDHGGAWSAGNLGFSDPNALEASVRGLARIRPDLVISSAAPTGVGVTATRTPQTSWSTIIVSALASIDT